MLRQAAGVIGAALSAAQGTGVAPSTVKSGVHDAANCVAIERYGDAGASPDSSTAPAGGSPGLRNKSSSGGMEMDRLMDVLGSVKDQLGRLERRQFESEASIMKQLASSDSRSAAPAGGAGLPQPAAPAGDEGLESARKMGVDVMAKLRGEVKDSDPTASPSRRLGALMRSADEVDAAASREAAAIASGSTVTRSPKQVRERAGELQHEVECDEVKMAEVVRGLGPDLVARHGVRGAAERIAQLYDTLSVDTVSLALAQGRHAHADDLP